MATFGYAGKILRVDLSSGSMAEVSTLDYADRFLGGRGIAAKIYWDEVLPEVSAFDAENRLIFATGPLGGVPTVAGSRWTVCGKSTLSTFGKVTTIPQHFCYTNLGGRWGAELKFAGYDAIVIQGKSEKPVYLLLRGETAELKDASALWGKGSIDTREILKSELGSSVRVVAIGPAGENMAVMANLLADNDASGRGGLGASMGSKKLKAIVVQGAGKGVKVAEPERLRELIQYARGLGAGIGRPPSRQESLSRWSKDRGWEAAPGPIKKDPCYGCSGGCGRRLYEAADGKKGKLMCQSGVFYQPWAEKYYGEWNDVPFYATKLCDNYGLDTMDVDMMISWLDGCYKAGILTDENTGIPISRIGSLELMETLVKKISLRDGFGDVLAQGIDQAADVMGPDAKEQVEMAGILAEPHYAHPYSPRLYIMTGIIYAMEPRFPIQHLHEVCIPLARWTYSNMGFGSISSDVLRSMAKKFWGSEIAVDFSTYEGKALAAKMIQDREYAKECLILCDLLWPMTIVEIPDYVGDPTLESKILSAVIGKEVDEEGLYRIGERVFNLQRAILVREGHHGRGFDSLPDYMYTEPIEWEIVEPECLMPGKGGEVISRKGAVFDREEFERMKDEYYQLRQWDVASGLQTRAKLEELELEDVAQDVEQRGLLALR